MDKQEIEALIRNLKVNTILLKNDIYREKLKEYLYLCMDKIDSNKLLTLLGENKPKEFESAFRQGVAELLIYFFFARKNISFDLEQNLNSDNNSNVDVVASLEKNFKINIEVKSPEIPKNEDNGKLKGQLSHRFPGRKEDVVASISTLNSQLDSAAKKAGKGGSEIVMPRDNKIKDTLISCQNKFSEPSPENLNCLLLVTNDDEFVPYWEYLTNEAGVGFFDPESFLNHEEFDKVNAVILTNGIELNEKHNLVSWDFEKSCTILICNRFSKNYAELFINQAFDKLNSLFPNQTINFVKRIKNEMENNKDNRLPLILIKHEILKTWKFE